MCKAETMPLMRLTLMIICIGLLSPTILCGEKSIPWIVDCHVHLWDINRPEGLGWIKKDDSILCKSFLPGDHESLFRANGVQCVVVVQAGQSLPDNQWNLDITEPHQNLFRGVVGNLSKIVGTDNFKPCFEGLCRDKRYLGYRLSGRYQKELSDEFFRDLNHTAEMKKSIDILIGDFTLTDAHEIARKIPNLRIILDHIGGITLTDAAPDREWASQLRIIAANKNVYCKVSGLFGRSQRQPAPHDVNHYKAALDHVFDCFGEDRLVFGSDWPVTETSGDYATVIKLITSHFESKGQLVLEKLFHKNAEQFYRIPAASTK